MNLDLLLVSLYVELVFLDFGNRLFQGAVSSSESSLFCCLCEMFRIRLLGFLHFDLDVLSLVLCQLCVL